MTWDPVSERLWKLLEAKPRKFGIYYASEVRGGPDGALVAQDSVTGARHLLMRVGKESDLRPDIGSRGVKLEFRRLEGADGGAFADFWCSEPSKDKLFGIMVDEVLGRWADGEGTGPAIAGRVLRAWRSLLSADNGRALSIPEQAGLFGELVFLEMLGKKTPHAVDCWHGPEGKPQDFVTDDWKAEVKASLNRTSVFIHGAEQLDSGPDDTLVLVVYQLALSSSGRTLVDQVRRVREQLGGEELERKLGLARFRDSDAETYAEHRFEIIEGTPHAIRDGFPRVTRSALREHCDDSAIGALQYEVLLAGLAPFACSQADLNRFPDPYPR